MKYRIHTYKFLISCTVAAFCLFLALYFLASGYFVAGAVSLAITGVYIVPAYQLGGQVSVDSNGVMVTYPIGRKQFVAWQNIQEIGIMGIKVFNRQNPKRTGTKYIYFSEKILTKENRFDAALRWPPAGLIYMRYDYRRLEAVRKYWKAPITLYNTGNLVVDPPIKE